MRLRVVPAQQHNVGRTLDVESCLDALLPSVHPKDDMAELGVAPQREIVAGTVGLQPFGIPPIKIPARWDAEPTLHDRLVHHVDDTVD